MERGNGLCSAAGRNRVISSKSFLVIQSNALEQVIEEGCRVEVG